MMRIGYVINCFPNFIEAMIYREVLALRAAGHEVVTFSIRRPREAEVPREARPLMEETIYILPVSPRRLARQHLRRFVRSPLRYLKTLWMVATGTHDSMRDRVRSVLHFAEAAVLAADVERLGVQHLHAHWAVGAATCSMVAARFLELPFTFTAHAYDIWRERLLLPEKLRAARAVVTCTQYNSAHLIEAYGVEKEKCRVVYHGLDLSRFRRKGRVDNAVPRVLAVGRLVEQKGYDRLVSVCAELTRRGRVFRCEIVGDGPLRSQLESQIRAAALEGIIELRGSIVGEELVECYEAADVFALFCVQAADGDRDGIPNTMIEAMAMELPVVSTRYSGVPELVTDGCTGLLVDPTDVQGMVSAVDRLLGEKALRRRLAEAGRTRVLGDFALASSAEKLGRLFEEIHGVTRAAGAA